MKRDMNIIRKIVLAVRDSNEPVREVEGVSPEEFRFHVQLIVEAGLAIGIRAEPFRSLRPEEATIPPTSEVTVLSRLTWDGHDFADSIQNDKVWKKACKMVMGPSSS
ncbi:MAG: DUF2513 domain-containing protein [Desulfobulbus sp.]|jgi:hypothetical protein|uniref:DUF2513 domain-containing protein n=1 Tax=Desulfobulbus sp. TaxID=895 RepID=UPI00283BF876|nr:DUF2513 domain-containing protein [Desulfobulbus sp.]MDR2549389.1 DUF2513 domain-containing protein [Desulfobulbus sp.]